ncbi:MAG: bifunctional oligoribonuclease/PAP phosphatase NrnA [bacterium]|nr:bifunctional oligoribonuclease/PAP phosphatase NrnA [bacterium]
MEAEKQQYNPTPKQQLIEKLKGANQILICAHENPDGDALGSALALQHVLDRLGKHVTVVASGKKDATLDFLNNFTSVLTENDIQSQPEFLIVLDETDSKAKNVEVRRVDDHHIALVLTAESGQFTPEKVQFRPGKYNYDLIVVVDCANKEQLGALYKMHERLFQNVPTVVIDHHLNHQPFGIVDLVEEKAAATAEILVAIIEALGQNNGRSVNLIDQHVATCLLTGLVTDTGSFQNSNTTPKSLTVAAQMLAEAADHRTIINRVFLTRPLSQLRLWGRALTALKEDKPLRFTWATLTKADFVAAQASEEEITGLIDNLIKTAAETDFVLLLTERKGGVHGSLRSIKEGVDVEQLAKLFGGGGHKQAAAFFTPAVTLAEYEQRVVNMMRKVQRERLNSQPLATG